MFAGGGGGTEYFPSLRFLLVACCLLSIASTTIKAKSAARVDNPLATIETIVAAFSWTPSLNESRRERLLANDERSQNVHQTGNHAGGLGSAKSASSGGPLFCHTSFTAR